MPIKMSTQSEFSFIVDELTDLDDKWPNGTRVFVTGENTEYRLVDGVFEDMGGSAGNQQTLNEISNVEDANNGDVITKDPVTGDAIFMTPSSGYISQSGTTDYPTTTGNDFAIGANSPVNSAKLSVTGDSNQRQLAIQGNATQTAPVVEFTKSDGTVLLSVSNTAGATFGGSSSSIIGNGTNEDLLIAANGTGDVVLADGTDNLKKLRVELSGATTNKTVTFISSHTDNRNITFPDQTGTVQLSGAATALTPGTTVTLTVAPGNRLYTDTITSDNENQTINASGGGSAGDEITIIFVTDAAGSNDEVITFGTNFRSTGTLTLANLASSRYVIRFISDGTKWNEVCRTGAQSA